MLLLRRGRLRPPVGWAAVAGGGLIAGIGFTVSILIASLAFHGDQLQEAKLGVLSAAIVAATKIATRPPTHTAVESTSTAVSEVSAGGGMLTLVT